MNRDLGGVEKAIEELFAEARASTEAQFRQQAQDYELRLQSRKKLEQYQRSLENLGGRGDDQRGFQDELRKYSPERLRQEKDEVGRRVQNLEEELAALQERHGRLNERREVLEAAEELSVLRQQRNSIIAELGEVARRWCVLTICLHVLRQARKVYEEERKQPVVRESEQFFSSVTGGRYRTIVAPHGGEQIQVIGTNGSRYDLDMLSRGTAEQLYLSLRFGYVREFGRRARPLPVVMDDILVNFDHRRALAAIGVIRELAAHSQVLFFTCHPEGVSLIQDLDPNVPVWHLQDGQARKVS
jgi:uncharacterized protein YhaN